MNSRSSNQIRRVLTHPDRSGPAESRATGRASSWSTRAGPPGSWSGSSGRPAEGLHQAGFGGTPGARAPSPMSDRPHSPRPGRVASLQVIGLLAGAFQAARRTVADQPALDDLQIGVVADQRRDRLRKARDSNPRDVAVLRFSRRCGNPDPDQGLAGWLSGVGSAGDSLGSTQHQRRTNQPSTPAET